MPRRRTVRISFGTVLFLMSLAIALAVVLAARRRRLLAALSPSLRRTSRDSTGETRQPEEARARRTGPVLLHPVIRAPESVMSWDAFDVAIGVSEAPVPGVVGDPFTLVLPSLEPLSVSVVMDGFRLKGGELTQELSAGPDGGHREAVLTFAPEGERAGVRAGTIEAIYSVGGREVGRGLVVVLARFP